MMTMSGLGNNRPRGSGRWACAIIRTGSAGTYGFRRPLVRDRWHNGARHGFFLDSEFCKRFWSPFLKDGTLVAGAHTPESPPRWLRFLSIVKLNYLLAALILLLTISIVHAKVKGYWESSIPDKPIVPAATVPRVNNITKVGKWPNLATAIDTLVPTEVTRDYYELTKQLTDWREQIDTARAEITVPGEPRAMEAVRNRITQLQHKADMVQPQRARALDAIVKYLKGQLNAGQIIAKGYDQDKKEWMYISPDEWEYLLLGFQEPIETSTAVGGLGGQTHLVWLQFGKPVASVCP
jgi:hypothetical protein